MHTSSDRRMEERNKEKRQRGEEEELNKRKKGREREEEQKLNRRKGERQRWKREQEERKTLRKKRKKPDISSADEEDEEFRSHSVILEGSLEQDRISKNSGKESKEQKSEQKSIEGGSLSVTRTESIAQDTCYH